MIRQIPALCGAIVMLGLLGGCEDRDPYRRTDVWYPSGANAGNLAAMVANPNDLIRGHGAQSSDGKEAATAIDHIWADKPKQLPDPTGAQGGSGGGSGAGG
jgi:type IV pilus biogenesis protein CpaD/CtpE